MKTRKFSPLFVSLLGAGMILLLILGAPNLFAQDKTAVGGKLTCNFVDQKQFAVDNIQGHALSLTQSAGNNISAKADSFMDGATVTNYSVGDLVKGTGYQFGYVMFTKDADTTWAKWDHETTTAIPAEGQPQTTFKGNFTYIAGTGQYKNIEGSGQYTGAFTSPTSYTVEWEGKYSIKK
ncbi:MAG: hypothetical protein A2W25_13420 [candidate division Zixibacteria bacterium RBG_16_53_22]|nr:MAG: hypothetical protein A2W25_13420 [candidate division Zixibacteria bacterium RBG_16_53_22]